jgi:hypothetical protein
MERYTMKRELVIEWKHAARDADNVFETCKETGMPLEAVLDEIRMLLEMEGVAVRMVETVAELDSLLFNGVPVEELLEGVEVTATSCAACSTCSEECGEGAECRTLRYSGEAYENIPPELIGRAAAKALETE